MCRYVRDLQPGHSLHHAGGVALNVSASSSSRWRFDDASTALCLSSPCCPDPSPTPIRKLSVSVHHWMGFAPRHQRDGSTPSSGTGGNTPDAINSVSSHLLLAYSRSRPRVAANVIPLGRRVSDVSSRAWFAYQYAPHSFAVSYIATTFSVGELSCKACVGAKQ